MRFLLLAALVTAITIHAEARQPTMPPQGKAAAKPKADSELIVGTWDIVGLETGGKAEPDRNYRGNTFVFAKLKGSDTATLREGRLPDIEFAYKLDPTASPKAVDLVLPDKNVTFRGIYKLEEDDLTICVSNGGPRPTEFATKPGSDAETFTLKRDRWERFSDTDYGFTGEMPTKPDERQRDIDTAAGMTSAKFFISRSEMERVTYVLAVTRLPGKLNGKETETAMTAVRNAAIAEVYPTAKPREEKKSQPKGKDAAQEFSVPLDVPNSKDRAAARVRQFVVSGDRLFVLLAAGPEDALRPESLSRFWGSLVRQPAGKKGKN